MTSKIERISAETVENIAQIITQGLADRSGGFVSYYLKEATSIAKALLASGEVAIIPKCTDVGPLEKAARVALSVPTTWDRTSVHGMMDSIAGAIASGEVVLRKDVERLYREGFSDACTQYEIRAAWVDVTNAWKRSATFKALAKFTTKQEAK